MGGLQLPGLSGSNQLKNFPGLNSNLANGSIGSIVTEAMSIVFMLAAFLSFIWFAWGAMEYIFAGGAKEGLASARKRMTWALVGLILFTLSFAVSQYAQKLIPQNPNQPVTNVSIPSTVQPLTPVSGSGSSKSSNLFPATISTKPVNPTCKATGKAAEPCPVSGWTCLPPTTSNRCNPLVSNQDNPVCPNDYPIPGQTINKSDQKCYKYECLQPGTKLVGNGPNCIKE